MKMTIVDRRSPINLIGLRHDGPHTETGPVYHQLAKLLSEADLWNVTGQWAGLRKLDAFGINTSFAGCVYPPNLLLPSGFERLVFPAGRYGRYLHIGSLDGLPDAWDWCETEGLREFGLEWRAGYAAEIFLSDPDETPPEDCQTEILFPIA